MLRGPSHGGRDEIPIAEKSSPKKQEDLIYSLLSSLIHTFPRSYYLSRGQRKLKIIEKNIVKIYQFISG